MSTPTTASNWARLQQLMRQLQNPDLTDEQRYALESESARVYPVAAMEAQEEHKNKIPEIISTYNTEVGKLAKQQDEIKAIGELSSQLSKIGARTAGSPGTGIDFSSTPDEEYKAQREALYAGLKAKMESPYIPRMPGVGSQSKQASDPLRKELLQSQIDKNKAATEAIGKPKPANEDTTLQRLAKEYDNQTKSNRERASQVKTLSTLLASGTPQSVEAAKTVMARLSGEVGALSNQDREAYAGSKAYIDQLQQFFNTKIAAEGFTPENKAAFEDLANAFAKSVEDSNSLITSRFETRGQVHGFAPGKTTHYLTGAQPAVPDTTQAKSQAVQSVTPAQSAVPAAPIPAATKRIKSKTTGTIKTLPADQADKFLADPTKFEEVK